MGSENYFTDTTNNYSSFYNDDQPTNCISFMQLPVAYIIQPGQDINNGFSEVSQGYVGSFGVLEAPPQIEVNSIVHATDWLNVLPPTEATAMQATHSTALDEATIATTNDWNTEREEQELLLSFGDHPTINSFEGLSTSRRKRSLRMQQQQQQKQVDLEQQDQLQRQEACQSSSYQPYHPEHFWCPLCELTYAASDCPLHETTVEPDTVVPSYAQLSLPTCLKLAETTSVDSGGTVRVLAARRLPVSKRFGPVVAPLIAEADSVCSVRTCASVCVYVCVFTHVLFFSSCKRV